MTDNPGVLSLTLDEEAKTIDLARSVDGQARESIITACTGYVSTVARTFSLAYQMEYDELVGIGNLVLVEKLDIALSKDNAYSYLKGCVKRHMRLACYRRYYLQESSLEDFDIASSSPRPDYGYLNAAINRLPVSYREVILMRYGLLDTPKLSLFEQSLKSSANPKGTILYMRLRRAMAALRLLLVQTTGQQDKGGELTSVA